MSERQPAPDAPAGPESDSGSDPGSDAQRFEPAPGVGRLLGWILLFVVAAVVVVLGGVYLT
ncbi:hypothetical protein [Streptomyces rishiriensis]|uniref:Uncharacterized protein n=1 Tax=Streptomyces rishiriensis TaxID=68264 RepID=A0ABU0NQD3_STRRH|nr:hypothetical protein [Streptomyces rishiriensis]MDQ0581332.1 hypothetical protein [Streptomyces rishiriensis]